MNFQAYGYSYLLFHDGLGSVPYDYDLYMGMLGMHGTPVSNYATLNTDLIIAIGSRFSDRVAGNREEFGREAKIIHFDIDASLKFPECGQ